MNYEELVTRIEAVIKENHRQEITGQIMQNVLTDMVGSLGRKFQFWGVASPDSAFTEGDENMVAIAFEAGTYTHFGGVELEENHIGIFMWDGEWHIFTKEMQGVFIAVYDETSGQELKEAVRSGKQVWCSISVDIEDIPHPFLLPLIGPNPDQERFVFSGIIDVDTYLYVECFDGRWYYYKSSIEPSEYLKSASIAGNTLTLTKKDGTEVEFTHDAYTKEETNTLIEAIKDDIKTKIVLDSSIINNKYRYYTNGDLPSLVDFFATTTPIRVTANSIFKAENVSSLSAQTAISMLCWLNSDGSFDSTILHPNESGTYTYTFERDGYVGISGHKDDILKYSITSTKLSDEVAKNSNDIESLKEIIGGYDSSHLPKLTTNPIEHIQYVPGLIQIFSSVGIIGDSLASGEMQGYHDDGSLYYRDMYEFSWGQQIAKLTGMNVYNFSQGGQSTKGWMQGTTERTWRGAQTNLKQCYFIGLGHNDKTRVDAGDYAGGIGTIADINDSDYTLNADSYVGWYARIIQAIKSVQPRAYIFCITTKSKNTYAQYNAQVRNIVSHFSGQRVYLIDLEMYEGDNPDFLYMGNHLSAAGYLFCAYEIMNYVDWIVRKNPNDFRYTSLVGTDIKDTNV